MKIAPFGVEQWMNEYEDGAVANLAETCVDSMTTGELLDLTGRRDEILGEIVDLRLSYGDIVGSDELRDRVAELHAHQSRGNVMIMNGGSAANFMVHYTLVQPSDEVVSVAPTYQQLYSIPESFGASVKILRLRYDNGFLPDLDELASLVTPRTKLICINNPNNPAGALMNTATLQGIADIASRVDAWVHCDEVYRFLPHDGDPAPSMADLYTKGVVTGSLSKSFSLAGLRTGWVVGPEDFIADVFMRRDYTTISCARIDDLLARAALAVKDKILARNLAIVRKCAKILADWVADEPRIDYVAPRAGTTAFLRFDAPMTSEEFCKKLYDGDGTFLLPGSCFGPEYDKFLRIGYAYSPNVLSEGLARVTKFLKTI